MNPTLLSRVNPLENLNRWMGIFGAKQKFGVTGNTNSGKSAKLTPNFLGPHRRRVGQYPALHFS